MELERSIPRVRETYGAKACCDALSSCTCLEAVGIDFLERIGEER